VCFCVNGNISTTSKLVTWDL